MEPLKTTSEMLDLLADGELSESQRAELLGSLEQEPDGWRRCAMAFLEAQCWKKELGGIRQRVSAGEGPVSAKVVPSVRPAKRRSSPFGIGGTLVSMAATFLVALSAGIIWQHWGNRPGNLLGGAGSNQIAGNGSGNPATTSGAQNAVAQSGVQWVRLSPAGLQGSGESIRLPAVERDRIDQKWLESLPSPIPQSVVEALERSGFRVQTGQELMPVPLKDGRKLVVPVDKVQLQYVGDRTY